MQENYAVDELYKILNRSKLTIDNYLKHLTVVSNTQFLVIVL